jgi:aspartyl/asparaginyl beta-hydroxylase (cupin superfamily)
MSYFYTPDEVNNGKLRGLEKIYPTLKKEWDDHSSQIEWRDFTDYQERTIKYSSQGHEIDASCFNTAPLSSSSSKWSIAPLFYNDQPYTRNTNLLPRLRKTMLWLGETKYVGMVKLAPDSRLGEHYDPDPNEFTQRFRCQLPFGKSICTLSVQSEFRPLTEGKLLIFQSSAPHKVQNIGDSDRISLIFDIFRKGRGIL